jgi:pimeloyl-ACP methyl ester carboxylesterase
MVIFVLAHRHAHICPSSAVTIRPGPRHTTYSISDERKEHERCVLRFIDWPIALVEELVRRGYRVINFDNCDVGGSNKLHAAGLPDSAAITTALEQGNVAPLPYTHSDMANDAAGLLDALGIPQAHIVGISMGGAIGQLVAIDHPQHTHSLTSRMADSGNPPMQAFRQAAQSVARSDSAFWAYFRRMRARLGPQQAIVATAYKIARTVYTMLKEHRAFQDIGAAEYDRRYREREVQYLQRKAAKLGFDLTPKPAMEPARS